MNLEELKNEINKIDVETDDFLNLFLYVSNKYYTVDNPSDYQDCVNLIRKWIEKSCGNFEDQVIVTAKIVEQIFMMKHEKKQACTGSLLFDDETYFFDIYTKETSKDSLYNLMDKARKSLEKQDFEIKNSKFGKSFYKKKKLK